MPPSGSVSMSSQAPNNEGDVYGHPSYADDMIGALGAALAGVEVGDQPSRYTNVQNNAGYNRFGYSNASSGSATPKEGQGWGSAPVILSGTSSPGFSGGSTQHDYQNGVTSLLSSGAETPVKPTMLNTTNPGQNAFESLQKGAYGEIPPASANPQSVRKKSIDIFLSQSPSQSLGEDLLRINSIKRSSSASKENSVGNVFLGDKGHLAPPPGMQRRDSSPSCSVTGTSTSSRSASPIPYSGNRMNSSAGSYDPPTDNLNNKGVSLQDNNYGLSSERQSFPGSARRAEYEGQVEQGHIGAYPVQHERNRPMRHIYPEEIQGSVQGTKFSPGVNSGNPAIGSSAPYSSQDAISTSGGAHISAVPTSQTHHAPAPHAQPQPAQQIFYMAVSTPDGRQVLQPVQMVQIPGQPPALMVPSDNAAQGMSSVNGGLPAPPTGTDPHPVMLVPTVQSSHSINNQAPEIFPTNVNGGYNGSHSQMQTRGSVDEHRQHQGVESSYRHDLNVDVGAYNSPSNRDYGEQQRQFQHYQGGIHPQPYPTSHNRSTPTSSQRSSPLLDETPNDAVASLYASPQRPPLSALLGHVRRLSRDQVGCRLLQQALDEEGPTAASEILNEGLSFLSEAMVDPFGNYLFQKILEKITVEERILLVKSVSPRLVNASLNLHGTRSVQKIVEVCAADEAAFGEKRSNAAQDEPQKETAADVLTKALAPAAARLCIDSHGNHVIQRILLRLSQPHSQFVFDAVAASVSDVARHRHGCCVIQRCLDSPHSPARSHLIDKIVEKSLELMQDAYGNYVVQYVLDVCGDDEVHAVCESVVGKVSLLAIQKFSSNVMEKCLERCTDRVREAYLEELSDPDRIRELMNDPFGNYVVQRALSVATHAQALRLVEAMKPHLTSNQQGDGGSMRNTAGGRRIIAKICRRFPNFDLGGNDSGDVQVQHHHHQRQNGHHRHHQLHSSLPPSPHNARSTPPYHSRRNRSPNHVANHRNHANYDVSVSPRFQSPTEKRSVYSRGM